MSLISVCFLDSIVLDIVCSCSPHAQDLPVCRQQQQHLQHQHIQQLVEQPPQQRPSRQSWPRSESDICRSISLKLKRADSTKQVLAVVAAHVARFNEVRSGSDCIDLSTIPFAVYFVPNRSIVHLAYVCAQNLHLSRKCDIASCVERSGCKLACGMLFADQHISSFRSAVSSVAL